MKHCYSIFFLLFIIFFPVLLFAQSGSYNLNINNYLPSNQVYDIITDQHGYLWISTPNGVIRYNGYDYKLFNLSTGLPYDDIWEMTEDKQGKIWMCSTSSEMGYIYNTRYYKAYLKDISNTIYPKGFNLGKDGVTFFSPYISGNMQDALCQEKNDTIRKYNISSALFNGQTIHDTIPNIVTDFNLHEEIRRFANILIDQYGVAYAIFNDYVYKLSILNNKLAADKQYLIHSPFSSLKYVVDRHVIIGNYLISYETNKNTDSFIALKLSDGKTQVIDLKSLGINEGIEYIFPDKILNGNKYFYIFTRHHILKFRFTPSVEYVSSIAIKNIIGDIAVDGSTIKTFHVDDFWNICIGTTNHGLWINSNLEKRFVKETKLDLFNYKYVGGKLDKVNFWWNASTTKLMALDSNLKSKEYNLKPIPGFHAITYYNADTFLITADKSYFLAIKSGKLISVDRLKFAEGIFSVILLSPTENFAIANVGFYSSNDKKSHTECHYIGTERYKGLIFDSFRNDIWAYNSDKLIMHHIDNDTIILKEQIDKIGKQKIEKVVIDNKYGNIFIKCENSIIMYDHEHNRSTELFQNFNLLQSSIFIYNSQLIVTGRFGIIFCKITGNQQLSEPTLYPNIKNEFYNAINDCQAANGKLLINTDKGVYTIKIPTEINAVSSKTGSISDHYKFILSYKDSISNIRSGDTTLINQKDLKLQFDVINPYGNGQLKYRYKLADDSVWHELNANELNLPFLRPGSYYKLSIIASDNTWRSAQMNLQLYVQPYWWQTKGGRRLVWALVTLGVLLLFTIAILLTRRLVLNAEKKRNLQMELELKSIYAQINPHFIFNTLNSALLLVSKNRMEDAYTHISKFSKLLRSYIKSSRNKLITIAEEMANLKNYIELQQTRFKNKFDFQISVDEKIEPDKVKIPSLLLQPFVENAINHGILNSLQTCHLKISFNTHQEGKFKDIIYVIIEDNGVGRKNSKVINEHNKNKDESYGDLMIKDLVNVFNKYEQMNIEIAYTDKEEPLTGTIVTIQIKQPHYVK